MQTEHPDRPVLSGIAAVAIALATAVLSLVLGATLCLALLLGGAVGLHAFGEGAAASERVVEPYALINGRESWLARASSVCVKPSAFRRSDTEFLMYQILPVC